MKALEYIQMAKRIRAEIPKKKDDYGSNVDKYSKSIRAGVEFSWYYGNWGNSSTYSIISNYFDKELVNNVVSSYLTENIDIVLERVAKAYEQKALKEKDELLKVKENIEKFLEEIK